MAQEARFTCLIRDSLRGDAFDALVTMRKHAPLDISQKHGTLALAHILIQPISGQLIKSWDERIHRYSVHNHFILESLNGNGRYIIRDRMNKDEEERRCSIWDLGPGFAGNVMANLQKMN